MEFKYKKAKNLEERKEECEKVKKDHPGKICLICEKAPKSQLPDIEKTKYLLKEDINLVQFTQIIRNKLKIEK